MRILCPHCGRPGNLPDVLPSGAHAVRCRRCNSRFAAVSFVPLERVPRTEESPVLADRNPGIEAGFGRFSSPRLLDESGEFDASEILLGPGDSQCELPSFVDEFADEDSSAELPAVPSAESDSTRIQSANVRDRVPGRGNGSHRTENEAEPQQVDAMRYSGALLVSDRERAIATAQEMVRSRPARFSEGSDNQGLAAISWNSRFMDFWSRYQIVTTVGFAALASGALLCLLWRSATSGRGLTPSTSALVVGLLGIGAFVILSLTALVHNVLLARISRELRRLNRELD